MSRSHLSREINSPETRLLMGELVAQHRKQVSRLVAKGLTRIGQALDAHATEVVVSTQGQTKTKTGSKQTREYKSVLAGVDHYARMTGVKRLTEMIQAAHSDAGDQRPMTITLEQFLILFPEVART